jgi:endonuclease YncB( thermonuclease family)
MRRLTARLVGGLLATTVTMAIVVPPIAAAPSPSASPSRDPVAAALGPGAARAAHATRARVTRIVDGDTLRTTKGTIRLIGVDTPERGQCNAKQATAMTRRLAPVGSRVTLIRPAGNNNRDAYGRSLRYITAKGVDVGGRLIKSGLADARYDSRDGFPRHPKQAKYRRWDARYQDRPCAKGSSSGGGTSSGAYTGCRAYGPKGTSVDEKGRRYTKIDCRTKKPL